MKKRILFTVIIVGIMTVSSLKAQFSIGPGLLYGTKIEQPGLSATADYDFNKMWGAMASYTYFIPKNSLDWWALDFNAAYNCYAQSDKSKLYVLAGLNLLYYKYPSVAGYVGSNSLSYTSVNVGAEWKLGIGKKMDLVPEAIYTFGNANYFRFGVKVMFGL